MFFPFLSSFKKIVQHFFLLFLGIFLTIATIPSPSYTSADGIRSLLQKVHVTGADQNVGLPKVDNKHDADKKTNHLLYTFIKILLTLAGIVSVVFIVIGGMEYTVSAGDDDRLNGAKVKILYAILGLLVVLFSYAIFTNGINFFEISEK